MSRGLGVTRLGAEVVRFDEGFVVGFWVAAAVLEVVAEAGVVGGVSVGSVGSMDSVGSSLGEMVDVVPRGALIGVVGVDARSPAAISRAASVPANNTASSSASTGRVERRRSMGDSLPVDGEPTMRSS